MMWAMWAAFATCSISLSTGKHGMLVLSHRPTLAVHLLHRGARFSLIPNLVPVPKPTATHAPCWPFPECPEQMGPYNTSTGYPTTYDYNGAFPDGFQWGLGTAACKDLDMLLVAVHPHQEPSHAILISNSLYLGDWLASSTSANVLCPPPARRPRSAPVGSRAHAPVALAPS